MLGKLVKHQLRDTVRIIPLALIAVAFFLGLTIIAAQAGAHGLTAISASFLLFLGFAVMYFAIGYCVFRFYKSVYGAEGYLTMTLPVTEKQVYASWAITGVIWIVVGTIVALASYYFGMDALLSLSPHTDHATEELAMIMGVHFKVIMILGVLFGSLLILIDLYFCITLAHVKPFRKLGLGSAVLAYIALYGIHTLVSLPLTFYVPLSLQHTPGTGWELVNVTMSSAMPDMVRSTAHAPAPVTIGIAAFFWYIVPLIIMPVITVWLMKKKINLK